MNTKEDIEDYIRNLKAQAFDLVMEQDFCKNKITILEGEKLKILEELSNIYDTINTKLLAQKQQPYKVNSKVVKPDFTKKGTKDEEKEE